MVRPRPRAAFRDFMRNLSLDDRIGRIALSIVLAVLMWFYVTSLENPARVTEFNDIPIEARNVGQNLKIINPLTGADVTLQAPQNVMSTLRPADVHPFVDLQGLSAGVHQIPVQLEVNGAAGRSLISSSVDPQELQVQLEAQAARVMTVTARTQGTPAFGFGIEQPQVDPTEVTVTGPQDAVNRVGQLIVEVNINGEATTQQGLISPIALDSEGQQIRGLTFEPESVQVVVPIKLLLSYKPVAVRPIVVGNPAPGYSVVAIIPEPRSVTICCAPEEVLDPIQSLDTQPIGITNTTSTVITNTQLIMPAGVELYPGQSTGITVTIRLETFETNFTLAVVPTVEGQAAGTSAVVSPSSIDVRLAGTLAQFQNLRPEDVRAVLDLAGRGPGTYEIEPRIIVPQGIKVVDAQPQRLTVSVLAPTAVPPTPTPTAIASPTPSPEATATSGSLVAESPSPTDSPEPEPTETPTPEPGASGQPVVSPVPTNPVDLEQTE
ncbi:MAG TPA: CdaR family protein [Chloroflexia bacterium]|nr:CdaR family protein [Chloroflexia bacterium]